MLAVQTGYSATTWTGAIDTNFANAGNWSNGLPGETEQSAVIDNGGTVTLTSAYTATLTYGLTISGNSTLNASAAFTATGLNIQNTGTVNLTGGAFTLPKTSVNNNGVGAAGILNISSGGLLNISGGNHIFNERSTVNGTFRVTGSTSTISLNQIGTATGTFDFVFDASGVSTVDGNLNFPWLNIAGASVTIDGTTYTGGNASFTLFNSQSAGAMPSSYTVTGLGTQGVDYTIAVTDNPNGGANDTVILNVIPEPSTAALLGLAGLSLLLPRKR